MPYHQSLGEIPKKRHVQFRKPDGGLYHEELMGEEGFSDDSALLYHLNAPPAIVDSVTIDYVGGDFMSRKGAGIEMGSISMHPAGFIHGPQPGSVEASIGAKDTEEYAVMIDTFRPLELCEPIFACEDTSYAWSWSGRGPRRTGSDTP